MVMTEHSATGGNSSCYWYSLAGMGRYPFLKVRPIALVLVLPNEALMRGGGYRVPFHPIIPFTAPTSDEWLCVSMTTKGGIPVDPLRI